MIVTGEVVAKWVAEACGAEHTHVCRAIGWMSEGKLAAAMMYDSYTGASIAMHARVEDASKVQREWLFAIFDYPFNQLGVKRVTALIPEDNQRSLSSCKHLGWKYETVLKDYFPSCDGIVLVMRKEDCRWLGFKKRTSKGLTNAMQSFRNAAGTSLQESREETSDA